MSMIQKLRSSTERERTVAPRRFSSPVFYFLRKRKKGKKENFKKEKGVAHLFSYVRVRSAYSVLDYGGTEYADLMNVRCQLYSDWFE